MAGELKISVERIGTSSPTFSVSDFREMYLLINQDFTIWEIVAEGKHHVSLISDAAKELTASLAMKLQIHAPLSDINIGSVTEPLRKASVGEAVQAIRVASEIGAEPVTVHPGHLSPLTREDAAIMDRQMKVSIKEIDTAAREFGVNVCLENMPNFVFTYCKKPSELLEAIEGTDLGITLDIGHARTNDNIVSFLYPEIVEKLGNVHIHDNRGDGDHHLTLGQGDIDLPWIVAELEGQGYRGSYIIESRDYDSSVKSKEYLMAIGELIGC